MHLIDTHAHLDDPGFDADRDAVIARAEAAGVEAIVSVGVSADSSQAVLRLAERYPSVFAAVGIQPNSCAEAAPGDWDRVVAMVDHPRVVALGETGLDRYWDFTPFEVQRDYFDRHLRLGQERDLPVRDPLPRLRRRRPGDAPRGEPAGPGARADPRLQRLGGDGRRVPGDGALCQLRRDGQLHEPEVPAASGGGGRHRRDAAGAGNRQPLPRSPSVAWQAPAQRAGRNRPHRRVARRTARRRRSSNCPPKRPPTPGGSSGFLE